MGRSDILNYHVGGGSSKGLLEGGKGAVVVAKVSYDLDATYGDTVEALYEGTIDGQQLLLCLILVGEFALEEVGMIGSGMMREDEIGLNYARPPLVGEVEPRSMEGTEGGKVPTHLLLEGDPPALPPVVDGRRELRRRSLLHY